jgi:hypothetical protein
LASRLLYNATLPARFCQFVCLNSMGIPTSQLHAALVIFLLTPEGDIVTVGGVRIRVQDLMLHTGLAGRGERGGDRDAIERAVPDSEPEFARVIRRATLAELPEGTNITSIRALIPRMFSLDRVVIPLWATGSVPRHALETLLAHARPNAGALERLSRELRDPSLVAEANRAFRQALAADPMVHQLVGDATRLRALSAEVIERASRPLERPLIASMLPELFTIDQLRFAVSQIAVAAGREVESSSNFRRRLSDLMECGVLVDAGESHEVEQRGRPPRLYRFELARWAGWLAQKAVGDLAEDRAELVQRSPRRKRDEPDAAKRLIATKSDLEPSTGERTREELILARLLSLSQQPRKARYARRAQSIDFDEFAAEELAADGMSAARSPSMERAASEFPVRSPDRSLDPSLAAVSGTAPAGEGAQQAPASARIEQLEQLVSRLSNDVETGRAETNRLLRLVEEQLRARRDEGGGAAK